MKGKIAKIFKSIQGEGIYQGITQLFIRFYGCNLSCRFCDTILFDYKNMSVEEVYKCIIDNRPFHSISLTGGEPLLQVGFIKKLLSLLDNKYRIYLETNGILADALLEIVDFVDIVAMDFKLPTSSGLKPYWQEHQRFLKIASRKDVFVKMVVGKTTTFEDLNTASEIIRNVNHKIDVVIQPQHPFEDILEKKILSFSQFLLEKGINVIIIPQLHKLLGVE